MEGLLFLLRQWSLLDKEPKIIAEGGWGESIQIEGIAGALGNAYDLPARRLE